MSRETFHYFHGLIHNEIKKKQNNAHSGRNTISTEKQLLLTLWMFATPDSYRSVCDRFSVGKATAIRAVRRVTQSILKLRSRVILWPKNEEIAAIHRGFAAYANFPNVLGAIDGTHIRIATPKEHPEAYINRKKYHSVQLQVVCDHTRKFLHCFVGYPGCVNDQRVFNLSGMQDICNNEENFLDNCHLVGDGAYSNQKHLLSPYRDNGHLTLRQRNFNYCLSSTRMVVERSIGLLKGRFRSLLDRLPNTRTDLIP